MQQRWLDELRGPSHWLKEWAPRVWSLFKYEAIVIAAPGGLFYHQGGDKEEYRWSDGNLTDRSSARLILYLAMINALRRARAKGLEQDEDPNWPSAVCAYDPHYTEQDAVIYYHFGLHVMGSFDSHKRFKAQPATPDNIFSSEGTHSVLSRARFTRPRAVLGLIKHISEEDPADIR